MIIEFDTKWLKPLSELSTNQLLFLGFVLNENQKTHQDIQLLLSRVSEHEIQNLVELNFLSVNKTDKGTIYTINKEKWQEVLGKEPDFFDELYEEFPAYVTRPDGLQGYLRTNINKCRKQYRQITGKSVAMHEHILKCLRLEISEKLRTGKLGYMKTMWKWLTNREWEVYEEQMKFEQPVTSNSYGTDLI